MADTRDTLLKAASALFVEQGYDETTMDDIAAKAGVARQTVFNYYRRKEDFILAWGARRRRHIDEVIDQHYAAVESTPLRLRAIFTAVGEFYESASEEGRVFTLAWVKWGGPVLEERWLSQQLRGVLEDGRGRGDVASGIDLAIAAHLLRAAYFDALWAWAAPTDGPRIALVPEMLRRVDLLLTAISPEVQSGDPPRSAEAKRRRQ